MLPKELQKKPNIAQCTIDMHNNMSQANATYRIQAYIYNYTHTMYVCARKSRPEHSIRCFGQHSAAQQTSRAPPSAPPMTSEWRHDGRYPAVSTQVNVPCIRWPCPSWWAMPRGREGVCPALPLYMCPSSRSRLSPPPPRPYERPSILSRLTLCSRFCMATTDLHYRRINSGENKLFNLMVSRAGHHSKTVRKFGSDYNRYKNSSALAVLCKRTL